MRCPTTRRFGILCAALMPLLALGAGEPAPSSPSVPASPFFSHALKVAKAQLDGATVETIVPVPTNPRTAARARVSHAGPLKSTGMVTSGTAQTCAQYNTCNGGASICSSTCSQYPTCYGGTTCTSTCSTFPTCDGGPTCTSTCNDYPTCNGSGTTVCESTCGNFPTCNGDMQTCTQTCSDESGGYPTCSGSGPTACGQATCNQYPTCTGTPITCSPTFSFYPTCNGTVVTICTETCDNGSKSFPTCDVTCFRYPTCNGAATCTQTCNGSDPDGGTGGTGEEGGDEPPAWPTCNTLVNTCAQSVNTCQVTCGSRPTCEGSPAPPTRCANTCSGNPDCPVATEEPLAFSGSTATLLLGLIGGALAVFRRRRFLIG